MKIYADLHIHSSFAGGTSKFISIKELIKTAKLKGLNVLGTGDILLPAWRKQIFETLKKIDDGTLELDNIYFIPQVEIEDKNRVHHVILFRSFSQIDELYEKLKNYSKNIDKEGRPKVELSGEEIAEICKDIDVAFGPAHAFVPWTSIYKSFNSLKECYGDYWKKISFLELGLSADTYLADRISELEEITFLSNSDAHSTYPHRLGREFNEIDVEDISSEYIIKAIEQHRVTLNVGLDPREGKYHRSACAKCKLKFTYEQAKKFNWRCPVCNGKIKKGVKDRIEELADKPTTISPSWRPKYYHVIPLTEIIQNVYGYSSPTITKVLSLYENWIKLYGNEINILLFNDINDMKEIDNRILKIIKAMRQDEIKYIEGGGGEYGKPILTDNMKIENRWYTENTQKNLFDFF